MTTKVIVRLLTADQSLLGWAEVQAVMRGDGRLWSPGPVSVPIEQAGALAVLSVHWADVNVESHSAFGNHGVQLGEIVPVFPAASPILIIGPMPGFLPAVTTRGSVAIPLEPAQMGARG